MLNRGFSEMSPMRSGGWHHQPRETAFKCPGCARAIIKSLQIWFCSPLGYDNFHSARTAKYGVQQVATFHIGEDEYCNEITAQSYLLK